MFTPAGAKSRATRVTKRTRLETTNDQAAIPIVQERPDTLKNNEKVDEIDTDISETRGTVAKAFNAVWTRRRSRSGSLSSRIDEPDIPDNQRTPNRAGPSLDQIEASLNRRGSLRSASKSIGRGSPSATSQRESDALKREIRDISLDYDVTQSSLDKSKDEDRALLAQLDETTNLWDQTYSSERSTDFDVRSIDKRQTIFQRLLQPFWFWLDFMRRSYRVTMDCATRSITRSSLFWHKSTGARSLGRWILSLLVLLCTIALPLLYVTMAQLNRSQIPQPGYVSPAVPAVDTHDIALRLHIVERSLESHYIFTQSLKDRAEMIQERLSVVDTQGQALEKQHSQGIAGLKHLEDNVKVISTNLENLQDLHGRTVDTLSQVAVKLDTLQAKSQAEEATMRHLLQTGLERSDNKFSSLYKDFEEQRSALAQLNNRNSQELVLTKDTLRASILEVIEESLPETLIISLKSGKAQSTAEFWRFFGEVFETKGRSRDDASNTNRPASSSNVSHTEEQLRTLIDGVYATRWLKAEQDGAIISRKLFLKLLHDELSPLMDDLQARVALLEQIPMESSLKRDSSSRHVGGYTSQNSGKNLSIQVVQQLVSTAIHKYSLDVLARPDYASYIAGARINPFLTSATYLHQPVAIMPRLISKVLGIGSTWSHPPAVAIHASNAVGMCWAFPGSEGQLGVKLAKPIYLTDIAIEHVHPEIAHDATTAPREVEIWIHLAEDSTDSDNIIRTSTEEDHIRRTPPAAGFVHIMDVIYNVYNKEQVVQLFPLPHSLRQQGVLVNQVVYRVKSNWGNEDFTCIYRVRAIGTSVTSNEAIEQDEDV